jgi:hypothetical protein
MHCDPATDPMLQHFLPLILSDTNREDQLHDNEIASTIWGEVCGHPMWSHEAENVNLNRFLP